MNSLLASFEHSGWVVRSLHLVKGDGQDQSSPLLVRYVSGGKKYNHLKTLLQTSCKLNVKSFWTETIKKVHG